MSTRGSPKSSREIWRRRGREEDSGFETNAIEESRRTTLVKEKEEAERKKNRRRKNEKTTAKVDFEDEE